MSEGKQTVLAVCLVGLGLLLAMGGLFWEVFRLVRHVYQLFVTVGPLSA